MKDAFGNPPRLESVSQGARGLVSPPSVVHNKLAQAHNALRTLAQGQSPSQQPSSAPLSLAQSYHGQFVQMTPGATESVLVPTGMPLTPMPIYPAIVGNGLTLIYQNEQHGDVRIHHPRHSSNVFIDRLVLPPGHSEDEARSREEFEELKNVHCLDTSDPFIASQVASWEPQHNVNMFEIPTEFEGRPLPKRVGKHFTSISFPYVPSLESQ